MTKEYAAATRLLQPHSILLLFLSSRFQAFRYRDRDLVTMCMWVIMRSAAACSTWRCVPFLCPMVADSRFASSSHQLARELRMRLLSFGFCVLQGSRLETAVESLFRAHLYDAAFSWFAIRAGCVHEIFSIQKLTDTWDCQLVVWQQPHPAQGGPPVGRGAPGRDQWRDRKSNV